MKNNVILLFIAIGLGFFTYFYQELGDRERKAEIEKSEEILNFKAMGELKSFSLPHVKVAFGDGHYELDPSGVVIDASRVEKFLGQLSYVKVKRVLEPAEVDDRKNFITDNSLKMSFQFQNGAASFILGEQLSFARDFYMEVEKRINGKVTKQIVVAFNSETLDQVYAKEVAHRSDHLYRRFKNLYFLSEEYFRDHRIFGPWMNSQWSLQRIYVDNNRNIGYSLLLDKKATNPEVPSFLSLDIEGLKKYEQKLAYLEAKKIIPFDNEALLTTENRLAMVIVSSTKGNSRFSLYKKLNSTLEGYYIVFPDKKLLYEVSKEQADLFLGSVQQFWSLKLWQTRPQEMSFTFNERIYNVKLISDKGVFRVESDAKQPVHLEFQKLISFLGQEASYWVSGEEVAQSYIKQFAMAWGKGEFFLMIRSGEILLYHRQSKQGLVYKIPGRIPFGVVEDDYFINE